MKKYIYTILISFLMIPSAFADCLGKDPVYLHVSLGGALYWADVHYTSCTTGKKETLNLNGLSGEDYLKTMNVHVPKGSEVSVEVYLTATNTVNMVKKNVENELRIHCTGTTFINRACTCSNGPCIQAQPTPPKIS